MYAWGPTDPTKWKKPGSYKYDDARKPYLDKLASDASKLGPRTYVNRSEPDMGLVNTAGKTITSDSKNPIIIGIDITGSMSKWPFEIFDRMPLLFQGLAQYEDREDLEMCIAAIGDATCDNYPLQVNDFAKGIELDTKVNALFPEGGGGGHIIESYELFAYFMLEHCKTPNATSPFLLIYGDEMFYENVNPKQVGHYIGDKLNRPIESRQVWQKLLQNFNLYLLHKPYGDENEPDVDEEVKTQWAKAIGKQRIIEVPSMDRAVDIAYGLIAKHWGEYRDFKKSMDARGHDATVKGAVDYSLRFIDPNKSLKSVVTNATLKLDLDEEA